MNIEIEYRGRRLRFDHVPSPGEIEAEYRRRYAAIERRPPRPSHPLSPTQLRIWFYERLHPGSAAYHELLTARGEGALDAGALRAAVREVVGRHGVLRTVFRDGGDGPEQVVLPAMDVPVGVTDLTRLPAERLETAVEDVERGLVGLGFDLGAGPLLRVHVIRCAPRLHVLALVVHHLVADGWSIGVLMDEIRRFYAARLTGAAGPLEPPLQFTDYAAWHAEQLEGGGFDAQAAHWREQLAPPLPDLDLSALRRAAAPVTADDRAERRELVVDPGLLARIDDVCRRRRVSRYMVLLSALYVLLRRYTGQSDIVIGMPVAGRTRDELSQVIGPLMNSLPLRVRAAAGATLADVLDHVRGQALGAYEHQDYPLDRIVSDARAVRGPDESPLYRVDFALQNSPMEMGLHDVAMAAEPRPVKAAPLDLMFTGLEQADTIRLECVYRSGVFQPAVIQRLLTHYRSALEAVVALPDARVADFPLWSGDERREAAGRGAGRAEPWPDVCADELFAARAAEAPERPAILFDGRVTTYAALLERARAIAASLARLTVGPGDLVVLDVDRSPDLYAAMLGVNLAGAAFVPLDRSAPVERTRVLAGRLPARAVVTDGGDRPVADLFDVPRLRLDRPAVPAPAGEHRPPPGRSPRDLMYVLHTSGSTGQPNGVLVTHRGLLNSVLGEAADLGIGPGDRVLQFAAPTFDVSVLETFLALATGATLVSAPLATLLRPDALEALLDEAGVTMMTLTPTVLAQLRVDAGRSLRIVTAGGEPCPPALARRWARRVELSNCYGATELPNDVTMGRIAEDWEGDRVPAGRPLPNTALHVLGADLEPVPAGVTGELFVATPDLAWGYLDEPGLTAERFMPDPFATSPGHRLYRTGDLARLLDDGTLDVIGRADDQVKIAGERVEPGEIEAVIGSHPGVTDCAVVMAARGDRLEIVAHVVAADHVEVRELRELARSRLPRRWVPAVINLLPRMPLTSNGKVDRRALAELDVRPEPVRPAQPGSERERAVLEIWKAELGNPDAGVDDNFFDVGGDSFALLRVQARLRTELGLPVDLMDLFRHPTVRALSDSLGRPAPRTRAVPERAARPAGERAVAVVGIGLRFPDASTPQELWANLRSGRSSIERFAADQAEPFVLNRDPRLRSHWIGAGAHVADIDRFDAELFGFSDRDAEWTNPQARLLMECAWAALEDAGLRPDGVDGVAGVYLGAHHNHYLTLDMVRTRGYADYFDADTRNSANFVASQLSYGLNLHGESIVVDSTCSSGLYSVHLAREALLAGRVDVALAGAANLEIPQRVGYLYQDGFINSSDGVCRPFDDGASGIVGGNGVAVVVLKRLADALRDGDPFYAVVRGSAANNDGSRKPGYSAPSLEGQVEVIRCAIEDAGIPPGSIQLVEAHGTGTRLGDQVELAALAEAFGGGASRQPCALGSIKSNLGHLNVAAGIAGFIKAVLAVHHAALPPTLHVDVPNRGFDFPGSGFFVNTELRSWPETDGPRRAGVSSFGIGGTNVHVVVESAPAPAEPPAGGRDHHLVTLSAPSEAGLARLLERMREGVPAVDAEVSGTLHASRTGFAHRFARCVAAGETAPFAASGAHTGRAGGREGPGVVFQFTGQGSQHPDMGRDLYRGSAVFRRAADECDAIIAGHTGRRLVAALVRGELSEADLLDTGVAQPLLFAVEYALAGLWTSWGVVPRAVLGHSLGELVAAAFSGAVDLEDAVRIACVRGQLMKRCCRPGAMASVTAPAELVEADLPPGLAVAALNGPAAVVVSGDPADLADACERWRRRGWACRALPGTLAFHSPLMLPMAEPYREALRDVTFREARIPLVSNLTGTWLAPGQLDAGYLVEQALGPVRYADCLRTALDGGGVVVEVGPDASLSALAAGLDAGGGERPVAVASLRRRRPDWRSLQDAVARLWVRGVDIDWGAFDGPGLRRVHLPAYPFERRRFWLDADRTLMAAAARPAVAAHAGDRQSAGGAEAPATAPRSVAELWAEVLGTPPASPRVTLFEAGGDSLSAVQLVNRLRDELGVPVTVTAFMAEPTLEFLEGLPGPARSEALPARPAAGPEPDVAPLSFSQERMWLLSTLDPESGAYNMAASLRYRGGIDVDALRGALDAVVRRHAILRATFEIAGGEPVQRIHPHVDVPVVTHDWSAGGADWRERYEAFVRAETVRPFDLAAGPLLRFHLVRLAPDDHVLLIVQHHIAGDVWSTRILVQELGTAYAQLSAGVPVDLPPIAATYLDLVRWQRSAASQGRLDRARSYWREALAGEPEYLELPLDRPRPDRRGTATGTHLWRLDPDDGAMLRERCRALGITPSMVFLGALGILLHRYSGQTDVLIGSAVAGRERPEFEQVVGPFVNTIPIRTELTPSTTAVEALSRARSALLGALEHQGYPFERLLDDLHADRTPNRSPLFPVLFVYQSAALAVDFERLGLEPIRHEDAQARFDLALTVVEAGGGFELDLAYAGDVFDRETVGRIASHLTTLLREVCRSPERPIADLPVQPAAETELALALGAGPPADAGETVLDRFEARARAAPDHPAVVEGPGAVTYRELDDAAGAFAWDLWSRGVRRGGVVAVVAPRSARALAAIIGTFKAGAAYVPLDPGWPPARLLGILRDARPAVAVAADPGQVGGCGWPGAVLPLPELEAAGRSRRGRPPSGAGLDDLAYLVYTSGSTGEPKGVAVAQRPLAGLAAYVGRTYGVRPDDRMLHASALSFDASLGEWTTALAAGATLVVADGEAARDPARLAHLIGERGVTRAMMTPSVAAELETDQLAGLRSLTLVGEVCPPATAERWASALPTYNGYGPTETTICASMGLMGAPAAGRPMRVSVGPAADGARVSIVDERLRAVPLGMPGELLVGGLGVAWGYWNRPDLTADRFRPDPFAAEPGARAYRTGDRGRLLATGELEVTGRLDRQVKVRGQRIEPAEVESALVALPGVRAAAVTGLAAGGETNLVAFVELAADVGAAELRQALRGSLPGAMIPRELIPVAALPLTSSGKVDLRQLLRLRAGAAATPAPANGGSAVDAAVAVWREVLQDPGVAAGDDFFALGGHSLMAVRAARLLSQRLGRSVPVRAIFERPTPAGCAALLEAAGDPPEASEPEPAPDAGGFALSLNQRFLWDFEAAAPGRQYFTLVHAVRLRGALDEDALGAAFELLQERHPALRTRVVPGAGGEPLQRADPVSGAAFQLEPNGAGRPVGELVAEELERPLNLRAGRAARCRLIRVPDGGHLLLLTVHRMVTDGASMLILAGELLELYAALASGDPAPARLASATYREFVEADRLRAAAAGPAWLAAVGDGRGTVRLAAPRPAGDGPLFPVVTTRAGLPGDLLDRAADLARRSASTMHAVLLAALRRALAGATGDPAPVVWMTAANRDERFEQLVGHCVELVPVRSPLPPAADLEAAIGETRRAVVEALTGRPIPYGFLLRHLGRPPAGPWAEGMSVLFDLQRRDGAFAAPPGLDVEVVDVPPAEGMMDLAVTVVVRDGGADVEVVANPAVAAGWPADVLRDRLAAALEPW